MQEFIHDATALVVFLVTINGASHKTLNNNSQHVKFSQLGDASGFIATKYLVSCMVKIKVW